MRAWLYSSMFLPLLLFRINMNEEQEELSNPVPTARMVISSKSDDEACDDLVLCVLVVILCRGCLKKSSSSAGQPKVEEMD